MRQFVLLGAALAAGFGFGATYYKVGVDAAGTSSFTGNVSSSVGWSTTQGATTTTTVSDWANSDFIIGSGTTMRLPATDAAVTFAGRSLTLMGAGSVLLKKAANGGSRTATFPNLQVSGSGSFGHGQDKSEIVLKGNITLQPSATLSVVLGLNSGADDWRGLVVDAALNGDETTALETSFSSSTARSHSSYLTLNSVAGFLGTIKSTGTARNFTLTVNGDFGGTITSLPAETVAASFEYEGVPAETGLRIATSAIPEVLKTKLTLRSSDIDLRDGGLKIMTFPAGTTVVPADFSIMGQNTVSGIAKKLVLETVENQDGTISLVTGPRRTFYKMGADASGTSSFSTNVSATVGWRESESFTATTPFSADEMAVSDFVVKNVLLRTPESGMFWTFGGRTLRLAGDIDSNHFMFKLPNGATVCVPDLYVDNATIFNGVGNQAYTLVGKITIGAGKTLAFDASDTGTRTLFIYSDIHGDATSELRISNRIGTGTPVYEFNGLENFTGTLNAIETNVSSFKFKLVGAFSGSVGTFSAKGAYTIDYDGLPADKGLRVSSTSISDGLKRKLTFYSPTVDFDTADLPLITFPAGTAVNPADFTIAVTKDPSQASRVLPALKVLTAADNSVVLAVDGSKPLYAKLKDDGNGGWAWRFYGSDWSDVTATCGLTEPNATITVCFDSTDEYNALKTHSCTAAGYRMTALAVNGDMDLTNGGFTFASARGLQIDLKGHKVVLPPSFFDDSAGPATDLVKLDWLEVPAGSYVDTGFKPNQNSCVEMDVTVQSKTEYWFGAWNVNYNDGAFCMGNDGTGTKNEVYMGYGNQGGGLVTPVVANGRHIIALDRTQAKVDGVVKKTFNANNFSLNYNLFLFAQNRKGTMAQCSGQSYIRFHGCRIYDNGVLVRDFVPVRVGNAVNLYDRRNNKTYTNAGNPLIPGPEAASEPAAAVTDTVGGGELHVNVPSGVNVHNTAVDLRGKLKFVKEGAGVFISRRRNLTYSGGNEIVAGKLMTTEGTGTNADFSAKYATLGALGSEIKVDADGTLDIAGNYDFFQYHIILDGGTLRSGKLVDNGPLCQSKTDWGGVGWVTLTADSMFYLRSDVVFRGRDDEPIDLGGHEFRFDAPIDSKYIYWQKDIVNGTIRLVGASSAKESFNIMSRPIDARTVDFIDGMGLNVQTNLSVRGYTCTRTWNREQCTGTAELAVYGKFTPVSDYFYGCTLQNGATLDLSTRTDTWSTTTLNTVGRKTVTFADNATILVDFGTRAVGGRKVVDWTDNTPANLDTLKFVCAPGTSLYKLSAREDGIYVSSGTMIYIR